MRTTPLLLLIVLVFWSCEYDASYANSVDDGDGMCDLDTFPNLNITVAPRTKLSTLQYESASGLAISRTGVVAAFYAKPMLSQLFYRTSTDKGLTWGQEMLYSGPPDYLHPNKMSVGLTGGGVLFMTSPTLPLGGGNPTVTDYLESKRVVFSDDFTHYSTSTSSIYMPNTVLQTRWSSFWPHWDKGKIIQLPSGDLLATMYGDLQGDVQYRTMLMHSTDQGQNWQYRSTVAYNATDPNPELDGDYAGFCEPSVTLLANGQLLAIMRTAGSHLPPYRPMYVAWSDDLGLTWTGPEPTDPYLLNASPTMLTLDNGVVAVAYGRPGVHVAFSTNYGHCWFEIETFDTAGEPRLTGYTDMIKSGPNEILLISGITGSAGANGGTYVYPIRVEVPSNTIVPNSY